MGQKIAQWLQMKYRDVKFTFRVGRGEPGIDVEVDPDDVGETGFRYAEIKPDKPWQVRNMLRQVLNWKDKGLLQPDDFVQPITYDADGNFYLNFSK